jgi:hypothetical protein
VAIAGHVGVVIVGALGLAVLLGGASGGCSSCDGDLVDGRCVPHCDDADCPSDSHCFDGECRPTCQTALDCAGGAECRGVKTHSGYTGLLCVGGEPPAESTLGKACGQNDDCAPSQGSRCVDGECTLTCDVNVHCGSAGVCSGDATDAGGNAVHVCEDDGLPRGPGQYGSSCYVGHECDEEGGFACLGVGSGDVDAYCTTSCREDADCPTGTFCALERTGDVPCTDVCGFSGSTEPGCIPNGSIGPDAEFTCGPFSLQRRICKRRSFCSPCETDADCRGRSNQICARDQSGQKICTVLCDPGAGSCPWGNATRCGVWDEALGVATCSHRSGSCSAAGESCSPCVDEAGCPGGTCEQSHFTGERFCVDLRVRCQCPDGETGACEDGGCPLTPAPANLTMVCYGGSDFVDTPYDQACVGAVTSGTQSGEPQGCWP